jgi:putative ABC transport system substrate-binding protein
VRVKPFDDALRGFKSVCKADAKTVVVSESEGIDVLRTVREERPELILAIGADALAKVKKIRDIPILYLMVLNPEKSIDGGKNVTGVNMNIPPAKYLALLEKLDLPRLRVGILYNPLKSGHAVKRILQAARSMGVEVTAREVHSPKEVPELLTRMKDSVTAFWMLPDPTVVTPETVEFLLLFSQQHGVPVVAFAGKYVEMGALLSLDIDSFDQGQQAGEMANKILNGAAVADLPTVDARKAVLKVNRKVGRKLGIDLDKSITSSLSNPE